VAAILRSLGAAVVMLLVVASTVSAGGPERYSGQETIDGWVFAECDGFDIVADGWFEIDEAVYTNHDGTLRIIQRFSWHYTLSRTDRETVVGTGGGTSVLLAALDGTNSGTYVGVRTTERYVDGSVVAEIGRVVFDTDGNAVFIAGPHPFETSGVDRCEHVAP